MILHHRDQLMLSFQPIIKGKKVTLRPFAELDYREMIEILNDPELKELTASVTTSQEARTKMTEAEATTVKEWYQSRPRQTDRLDLAIYSQQLNKIVGEVVLNEWEPETASCNYRILIGPEGRNRGFGSEATRLIVDFAFNELKLHRLTLEVLTNNPRARKAYEKAGFIYEGSQREVIIFDDQWRDLDLFSLIASDYQKQQSS